MSTSNHRPCLPQFVESSQENSSKNKEESNQGEVVRDLMEDCDLGDQGDDDGRGPVQKGNLASLFHLERDDVKSRGDDGRDTEDKDFESVFPGRGEQLNASTENDDECHDDIDNLPAGGEADNTLLPQVSEDDADIAVDGGAEKEKKGREKKRLCVTRL